MNVLAFNHPCLLSGNTQLPAMKRLQSVRNHIEIIEKQQNLLMTKLENLHDECNNIIEALLGCD